MTAGLPRPRFARGPSPEGLIGYLRNSMRLRFIHLRSRRLHGQPTRPWRMPAAREALDATG